jgi:glycosyltransferase involved in cell wall biosynthesis
MPAYLAKAAAMLPAWRLTGRLDLLHLNVAGRGSTLRKLVLSEVAGLLGIPTIVHLHDYDYRSDLQQRGPLVRWLTVRMFQRAIRVIVLGERDRKIVEHDLQVVPANIVRLANAVPDAGQPPKRGARSAGARLVFLGHLDDRKGIPELLAALARPALRQRAWTIDLAGGGMVTRFEAEARRLGISDRATFHGWLAQEKVAILCRAADIFVLPSHAEGQAMSLLEAMAHGLAILTTPVGAHLEAVSPDREALIVEPGDVDSLAAALIRLIDDPGLRDRLGCAARQRFLAAFNVTDYAARLAALYEDALAGWVNAQGSQPMGGAAHGSRGAGSRRQRSRA